MAGTRTYILPMAGNGMTPTDYYTKTETNALLAVKADTATTDSSLALKADITTVDASLALKANLTDVPTKTSDLTNDSGFITNPNIVVISAAVPSATYSGTLWSDSTETAALASIKAALTDGEYIQFKDTTLNMYLRYVGMSTEESVDCYHFVSVINFGDERLNGYTLDFFDGTGAYGKIEQVMTGNDLATVATTGSYNDLSNTPTIGDGTITITQGGVTKGTFTTNQSGNTTVEVDAGGGGNAWYGTQAEYDALATKDADTQYFISDKIDYVTDIKRKPDLSKYDTKTNVAAQVTTLNNKIGAKSDKGWFGTQAEFNALTPSEGKDYFIQGDTVAMVFTFDDNTTATYNVVVD